MMRYVWLTGVVSLLMLAGCGKGGALEGSCYDRVTPDPYQGVGYLENGEAVCTATLISTHVILTAAHCVAGHAPTDIRFTLSPTPDLNGDTRYATGAQMIIHPTFDLNNVENPGIDIALVQLSSAAYEYGVSGFIPVGNTSSLRPGMLALNVGYGVQKDGSSGIKRPKQVRFSSAQTLSVGSSAVRNGLLTVTRGPTGDIGCAGDSGSPLLVASGSGFALVGVYSESESNQNNTEDVDCRTGITRGDYISIDSFGQWAAAYQSRFESSADQLSCQ